MPLKQIFILLVVIFSTAGCKKYPEDENFHLHTVKTRLARSVFHKCKGWYHKDTLIFTNETISFCRDGSFYGTFHPFKCTNCSWDLVGKKERLQINNSDNGIVSEYSIIKLDRKSLWLQNDSAIIKMVLFDPDRDK